jgi:hypothetical protein
MTHTGGWTIWGNLGGRLRQFTVAEPAEDAAIETLKAAHPGIEIVSRHSLPPDLIKKFGAKGGSVTEWMPIDPKGRIERAGGVPIDKPMKG